MTNILVTGGLGFIGSNFLFKILNSNNNIINIDNETYASVDRYTLGFEKYKNYKFEKVDINNYSQINQIIQDYSIDKVFHFAAESHVDNSINDPILFAKTNILGTLNLIKSFSGIKKSNKLFIHVSTDEVYGSIEKGSFDENSRYNPNSPYSASKASSDHFVRAYIQTFNLPAIITNCCNNFGPYQNKEKFIPTIINSLFNRKEIPIYGNGSNIREWMYVDDHVDALFYLSNNGSIGESYCIGSGHELSNIELAKTVCLIFDKLTNNKKSENLISFKRDRKGHDFRYSLDSTKLKECGWESNFNFISSLEKTIKWYLNNKFFFK